MSEYTLRPVGELAFALILAVFGVFGVWASLNIAPLTLSSPSALPAFASVIMTICAITNVVGVLRARKAGLGVVRWKDLFPSNVLLTGLLFIGFALAFQPLGFIAAALPFLFITMVVLKGARPWKALLVALVTVLFVFVVFRVLFLVLLPQGIIPDRAIISGVQSLFSGGA